MATIRQHMPNSTVTATCRRCGRQRALDLAALAPRWGGTELDDLPLRCVGLVGETDGPGVYECGGRAWRWSIVPIRTGAG